MSELEREELLNIQKEDLEAYYAVQPEVECLMNGFCELYTCRRILPLIQHFKYSLIDFNDLSSKLIEICDMISEQLLQR
jgi:hypothetical protein